MYGAAIKDLAASESHGVGLLASPGAHWRGFSGPLVLRRFAFVAIMARRLDWRAGWRSGAGDLRLGFQSDVSGFDECWSSSLRVGSRGCRVG